LEGVGGEGATTLAAVADEPAGQVKQTELDAEAAARRRAALAQIRQYGDAVLRLRALEVETFDQDLVRLVGRMKPLMADAAGIGLAATQVGILRRVFVFQSDPDAEPLAVVNPVLSERSPETEVEDEGCLSLQGVLVPVERHVRVVLEGADERGEPLRMELEGYGARVAQHEVDHLDGMLMLDRTTPEARREALAVLRPQLVLG
jgi:peptide deformylase